MNLTVAKRLGITPRELQRSDLLNYIKEANIRRITFHYTALDGKLKELIIPINSMDYAERVLAAGERVDGSSLFKKMVPAGGSDLYVVPVYASAFISPFDPQSMNFICRYLDRNEQLAEFAPANILANAALKIRDDFGLELWGLGELEFYIIGEPTYPAFPMERQVGYHSSSPYSNFNQELKEMVDAVAGITGRVKYAHSEVGAIHSIDSKNTLINGKYAEQYEIEFLPAPIEWAADYLSIAKWVVRNVAAKYGHLVTFIPKLKDGDAGTGLHFHLELLANENNIMTNEDGSLSDTAKLMIGGLCEFAPSLTAIGNMVASSYLRLVPNQESPTSIFWSDLNRSAMVRVPLGWKKGEDMASIVNHNLKDRYISPFKRQTVELRTADGSAQIHLLLAGIAQAIHTALSAPEKYLTVAAKHYLKKGENKSVDFPRLPGSCVHSARIFEKEQLKYQSIFPEYVIKWIIQTLRSEDDEFLQKELTELPETVRNARKQEIMHRNIHIG